MANTFDGIDGLNTAKLDVFCPNCGRSVMAQFECEEDVSPTEQDAYIECSKCGADIHIIYQYKLVHVQVA